jgi:hypothetical protein
MKNIFSSIIFLGSVALLASSALAQTRPEPPTLCADGSQSCDSSDTSNPVSGGKKWNPGHYVKTQGAMCDSNQDNYFAGVRRNLDNYVVSSDAISGALVIYAWGALETNEGRYDWSRVREHLDWLSARDKHLLLVVSTKCVGTENPEWSVPQNLEGQTETSPTGVTAALWRSSVMDQLIRFWTTFAREFDGHPNLEMVAFGAESCPSWKGEQPADYTHEKLLEQQIRLYKAMAGAFKETIVSAPWNCSQGDTIVEGMEAVYRFGLGHTSPDAHDDTGNMVFRGELGAARDYRGKIAHRTIVSQPNLGGKDDILPLSNIQSLIDVGKMTHVAWVLTVDMPGASRSDIIAHIEDPRNRTFQSCPTRYADLYGGCR